MIVKTLKIAQLRYHESLQKIKACTLSTSALAPKENGVYQFGALVELDFSDDGISLWQT